MVNWENIKENFKDIGFDLYAPCNYWSNSKGSHVINKDGEEVSISDSLGDYAYIRYLRSGTIDRVNCGLGNVTLDAQMPMRLVAIWQCVCEADLTAGFMTILNAIKASSIRTEMTEFSFDFDYILREEYKKQHHAKLSAVMIDFNIKINKSNECTNDLCSC